MKKMLALLLFSVSFSAFAQDIALPPSNKTGGMPLMRALSERHSARNFDGNRQLDNQILSDLLWAAFGQNRVDGKRTAPTARNVQDIQIYVALKNGVYLYNPSKNHLKQISTKDIRSQAGMQADILSKASAVLIYVSDYDKIGFAPVDKKAVYAAMHAGSIYQNVSLFAASEGLISFVVGSANYDELPKLLSLPENQKIIVVQPVGYAK